MMSVVKGQVLDKVWARVEGQVWKQNKDHRAWDQVKEQVKEQVENQVGRQIRDQVRHQVRDEINET